MAASFVLSGKADDVGFAEAERLCDILCAMLPSCVVVKLPVHPDDWEEKKSNIGDVLGCVFTFYVGGEGAPRTT